MGKHTHHPTTKLLSYRQYWTFQGFYRVKAKGTDMTPEDVFSKCILHVARWLKDRSDYAALNSEMSFLAYYPSVDEYRVFGEYLFGSDSTVSQRAKKDYDIGVFAYKAENTWTVRVIEPDNAKETGDYPGRVFITNIAIKGLTDEVYVAIRTTCKEPSNNESEAAAFRPACLYYIYEDDSLEMYEGGIKGCEYPINGDIIRLKTHSNTACQNFYDELVNNKERQMPIVLCPAQEDDDINESIEKLANSVSGLAYVIVEEKKKNYAKLFYDIMKDYIRFEFAKNAFVCLLPCGCNENDQWLSFPADKKGIRELRKYLSTYTVKRDGEVKTPKFSYGEVLFYGRLWDKYVYSMTEAADSELLNAMRKTIDSLAAKSESLPESERDKYEEQVGRLSEDYNRLEESNTALTQKVANYKAAISEKNSELESARAEIKQLKKSLPQISIDYDVPDDIIAGDPYDSQVSLQWNESFPQRLEDVVSWLRKRYGDSVVIHRDAERAFNKLATDTLNIKRFCEAFGYLDAYVRFKNGSLSPEFYRAVAEKTSFRAEPHGFKESAKDYPAYYVDINEKGYCDKSHLLDLHLKYSSQSKETFRIYFSYIPELKKAVVGSMPDHLCQKPSDRMNRRNKA